MKQLNKTCSDWERDCIQALLFLAVLLSLLLLASPSQAQIELGQPRVGNPGCPSMGKDVGTPWHYLDLKKVIVDAHIAYPRDYPMESLPAFLQEQKFPQYALDNVKAIVGPCIQDERLRSSNIELSTDRTWPRPEGGEPGTLMIWVHVVLGEQADLKAFSKVHYALLWIEFDREADQTWRKARKTDPHIFFLNFPEATIKTQFDQAIKSLLWSQ